MKRRNRKNVEILNLSFLDVISCGFGAIILLLVMSKISQPIVNKSETEDLSLVLNMIEKQLKNKQYEVIQTQIKLDILDQKIEKLSHHYEQKINYLNNIQIVLQDTKIELQAKKIIKEKMHQAQQTLTDEMHRLQKNQLVNNKQNTVGGISVDSEYIIFIIDTSGSMQKFAWLLLRKKVQEILEIHPNVKGIQVMNDMGDYMFSQYAGRWIEDTPARRRTILKHLASWEPFSNSSPEEGITRAIRQFYKPNRQISLFILGDDFSRGSIQSLLDTVDRLNYQNHQLTSSSGEFILDKSVRINAIGFPVLFNLPGSEMNLARFSALMRKLAENNNGSFVGLTQK